MTAELPSPGFGPGPDVGSHLFQRLERCVGIVTSLTSGLSEREANDALNAHVSVTS